MEEVRLDILKAMDHATIRGIRYIEEYLREHGGIIEIDDSGDKMYAIVLDQDLGCDVEVKITGLRLNVNEMEPKGELELRLDNAKEEWVPMWEDIYALPTVQSILEAINQYK